MVKFSCYVLGETNLALECLIKIHSGGHEIKAVVSGYPKILAWAKTLGIACLPLEELSEPVDYLFSLVNYRILKENVLSLAEKLSINYHDAPLPKFAGMHATSWALYEDVQKHGVTFHEITSRVDAGKIIKQAVVPVNLEDTALDLNMRCIEAAIGLFSELLASLEAEDYTLVSQDLAMRSYYPYSKKLPSNGLIDWGMEAAAISRIHRALTFGPYRNSLGVVKFRVGDRIIMPKDLKICEGRFSKSEPGTIISISDTGLVIATKTCAVEVSNLVDWSTGNAVMISELVDGGSICGYLLPSPTQSESELLRSHAEKQFFNELYWAKKLTEIQAIDFPYMSCTAANTSSTLVADTRLESYVYSENRKNGSISATDLFHYLMVYLFRINDYKPISVAIKSDILIDALDNAATDFYAGIVPLTANLKDTMTLEEAKKTIALEYKECVKRGLFLRDLPLRYPECGDAFALLNVSIVLSSDIASYQRNPAAPVEFVIDNQTAEIAVHYMTPTNQQDELADFMRHFLTTVYEVSTVDSDITLGELPGKIEHFYPESEVGDLSAVGSEATMTDLFRQAVVKFPNRIALQGDQESHTYGELDQESNRIANYLCAHNVGTNSVVMIYAERSPKTLIWILGTLKAGAAYLPVSVKEAVNRVDFMIKDAQPTLIVTQSELSIGIIADVKTVFVETAGLAEDCSIRPVDKQVNPNDLAYIIYTSGSTGNPKGVMVGHGGVVNCVEGFNHLLNINEQDIFLAVTSLTFDVSVTDYFSPWAVGARVIIASEDDQLNVEPIVALIAEKQITVMQATPTMWQLLIDAGWQSDRNFKISTAGEALLPELAERLVKRGTVYNIYGPTENTIYSTACMVSDPNDISIGYPMQGVETLLLDRFGNRAFPGMSATLFLSGRGVAQGYLNRDQLTDDRFKLRHGRRVYNTGDVVTQPDPGKPIYYLGRFDGQIKHRGRRIELAEIRKQIEAQPMVIRVIVDVVKIETSEVDQIVAYVLAKEEVDEKVLRASLSAQLPAYMIPSLICVVDQIPLLASGKIDHKKLSESLLDHPKRTNVVLPNNSAQEVLRAVFAEALGVSIDGLSVDDNFFAVGGDSIKALRAVRLARRSNIQITAAQIFEFKTVAELSNELSQQQGLMVAEHQDIGDNVSFNLTPVQQWFFEQDLEDVNFWQQSCLLRFAGDANALGEVKQKITILANSIRAFKLRFKKSRQGQWSQYYATGESIQWTNEILLSSSSESNHISLLQNYVNNITNVINIETGPLMQGTIVRDAEEVSIVLSAHHLVMDGVSWRIFFEALDSVLDDRDSAGLTLSNTTQYYDWVTRLAGCETDNFMRKAQRWLKELVDVQFPSSAFTVEDLRDKQQKASRSIAVHTISDSSIVTEIKKIPQVTHFSSDEVLLSLFVKLLADAYKQNKVAFNLERHGRESIFPTIDLSSEIGWFTSLFPVVFDISGLSDNLHDFVEKVSAQIRRIPNNGIPYGVSRYTASASNFKAELAKLPPLNISFNNWGEIIIEQLGLSLQALNLFSGPKNHDVHAMDFNVCWTYAGLELHCFYDHNHFSEEFVNNLLTQYADLLFNYINTLESKEHVEAVYPLTAVQKGIVYQSLQDSSVYINQLQVTLRGVDIDQLRKAWVVMVERHDVLRARIAMNATLISHEVSAKINLPWTIYESSDDIDLTVKSILEKDRSRGYDLQNGPLFRLHLVSMGNDGWVMIFSHHHVIFDGWSLVQLLNELYDVYTALSAAQSPDLSEVRSFRSFVESQQGVDESDRQFWREYLSGFEGETKINFQPHANSNGGGDYPAEFLTLDDRTSEAINFYLKENAITLNTLTMGVWGYLLSQYSGDSTIVFASTVSMRDSTETAMTNIIGPCINTIPVRIAVDGGDSISSYLAAVQNNMLNIFEHCHVDLQTIRGSADLPSTLFEFSSLFVCGNYPYRSRQDQVERGFAIDHKKLFDLTDFGLTVIVIPGDEIGVKITFDNQKFSREQVKSILSHFSRVVRQMLSFDATAAKVQQLSLLSPNELGQLDEFSHGEKLAYDQPPVHRYVERQVAANPGGSAIVFGDDNISYAEMNRKANQLAHYFRMQYGISTGDYVAIRLAPGINMIITVLAVLKSGAAYVPIDANYPAGRVEVILEESKATLIVLDTSEPIGSLAQQDFNLSDHCDSIAIDIAAIQEDVAQLPEDNLTVVVNINDPCYVVFTSGTTGRPKGVNMPHKAVVNLIEWQRKQTDNTQVKRVVAYSSFGFDQSVQETFFTLFSGHTLFPAPPDIRLDMPQFIKFLLDNEITQTFLPTSLLPYFIDAVGDESLSCLTDIIVAGEGLKLTSQVRRFFESHPHIRLNDYYGPSESHVCSAKRYPDDVSAWQYTSIGRPIANSQLCILDQQLRPVGIGLVGELYIAGDCLALGYLNRDDLTEKRFITIGAGRYYKTGDLARWSQTGELCFLGRNDAQIKINGCRVEPKEVEAVILGLAEISHCAVLVESGSIGHRLVAYCVADGPAEVAEQAMNEAFARKLPTYMYPSSVQFLEKLPLNDHGKVDRRQLRSNNATQVVLPRPDREDPADELEELIHRHWLAVLGPSAEMDPGVLVDFSDAGGDSMAALALISRLNGSGVTELSVSDLNRRPATVRQLAVLVVSRREGVVTMVSEASSNIVRLSSSPIFLIHPIGGTLFGYKSLANNISDKTILGIEDPAIATSGIGYDFGSIEDIAKHYVKLIRCREDGPYFIGGHSSGGVIAQEVARQLKELGEEVSAVLLLDSWAENPDFIRDESKFRTIMGRQLEEQGCARGFSAANFKWLIDLQWRRVQLLWNHQVAKTDIPTVLFKARENLVEYNMREDRQNYWGGVCSNLAVYEVPGNHETMFSPDNIPELARAVAKALACLKDRQPGLAMTPEDSGMPEKAASTLPAQTTSQWPMSLAGLQPEQIAGMLASLPPHQMAQILQVLAPADAGSQGHGLGSGLFGSPAASGSPVVDSPSQQFSL